MTFNRFLKGEFNHVALCELFHPIVQRNLGDHLVDVGPSQNQMLYWLKYPATSIVDIKSL